MTECSVNVGETTLKCMDSTHVGNYTCIKNSSNCFYEDLVSSKACAGGETCSNGVCGTVVVAPFCGDTKCNNGETWATCPVDCPAPTFGKVTLNFSNTVYSLVAGVNHTYTSTRTFTEVNGVGVTLTSGTMCYQIPNRCDTSSGFSYRIDSRGTLVQTAKRFITNETHNIFNLTYYGIDDNGINIAVSQRMCVSGTTFTENC